MKTTLTTLLFAIVLPTSINAQSKIDQLVLFHALEQHPQGLWYPLIQDMAKERRLVAVIPQLAEPTKPKLPQWEESIAKAADKSPTTTILIAHSLGATALLHHLSKSSGKEKFPLLILVAPTVFDVGYDALKEFFAKPFQYETIKSKVEKIVVIITPTDPVLKPDPMKHGLTLVNQAGAKLIVLKEGNHFWQGDNYLELQQAIKQEVDALIKPPSF